MSDSLLKGSDKQYWHRYLPVYEARFKTLNNCNKILEFGVFKGESIRWLNDLFPGAEIYGSDILDVLPEWPVSENIKYFHVDQGDVNSIKGLFQQINGDLDLIIEDGSHLPEHQKELSCCRFKAYLPGRHVYPGRRTYIASRAPFLQIK